LRDDWRAGGFGLYVHWPFCAAKCPYCDFNSHVSSAVDMDAWQRALVSEVRRFGEELPGRILNSVYFGGGTPSLMDPSVVEAVLHTATDVWTPANDMEVTLEANPSSVEAKRFEGYRVAGVNRVSMGFQALNDGDLRALGRLHDVSEALQALDVARSTFDRFSFDLIYARQNQSLADWDAELKRALDFDPDHLSLYQLTIESGTAFGDRFARGGLRGLPDEDLAADMYFHTQELCEAAGLPAYEVSNHAKPGQESRHNLIYWSGGDYVGIGPGAHGRVTTDRRYATTTPLSPENWLAMAEAGRGELDREALSAIDQAGEYLMMGLRTVQGIDLQRYGALSGQEMPDGPLNDLIAAGLLIQSGDQLATTAKGRAVLNAIVTELLPD
jgi:putative oxygen-independent coproporphyrinogen III oxidase